LLPPRDPRLREDSYLGAISHTYLTAQGRTTMTPHPESLPIK
jgi:hypothetical protein